MDDDVFKHSRPKLFMCCPKYYRLHLSELSEQEALDFKI